jgi:uncharacterized protein YjiS (DUF1127 family)
MLPQAIQEFRSVVEESPDRFDARVGLAEALWRNGDEQEASEELRAILQQRSDVLKANLLLGYILLASGDGNGEHYWQKAQRLDPYQSVARTLFETLPEYPDPDTSLTAWDEQAWTERRNREAEERRAQEQVAVAAGSGVADDDFFSAAWMEPLDSVPLSPRRDSNADDDFLASLLAMEALPDEFEFPVDPVTDSMTMDALVSDESLRPFTLADDAFAAQPQPEPDLLSFSLEELAPAPDEFSSAEPDAVVPQVQSLDESELTPFSLEDLGLSREEIAALAADELPAQEAAPGEREALTMSDLGLTAELVEQIEREVDPTPVEPELTPFSLEDLGLSREEIAALAADELPAQEAAPGEREALTMSDLGLTAELVEQIEREVDPTPVEPELTPFSLEDLGLSQEEIAALGGDATPSPAEPELTPFSLDDLGLGLSAEDIAAIEPPPPGPGTPATPEIASFDWGRARADDESSVQAGTFDDGFSELTPFSIDDLDLNIGEEQADLRSSTLPPSLQPFSIDDGSPPPPLASPAQSFKLNEEEEGTLSGYSWQQPSPRQGTGFLTPSPRVDEPEETIFSKLRQMAIERGEMSADTHADADAYFSDDDVSLRDDDDQAGRPSPFNTSFRLPREGDDENDDQASSISARGVLAAGSIAAAFSNNSDAPPVDREPELKIFSPDDPGRSSEEAEPELTPFSLEELGLSAEEIALLNGGGLGDEASTAAPVEPEAELTPFSLGELGLSAEEIALLSAETTEDAPESVPAEAAAEPELTPFSLEELGLSAEEIALLNSGGATAVSSEQPALDTMTPFSFDDVGQDDEPAATSGATRAEATLDDVGVEPFSLDDLDFDDGETGAQAVPSRELGISAEELAGLDLGDFEAAAISPTASETGDPALDRLLAIGRRQGFVELTDIIAVVENPEEETDRIEQIGWGLHNSGIQIRDQGEIIDMTETEEPEAEEFVDEELSQALDTAPVSASEPEPEPDLTPFSLTELGLTEEEIAALGLAEVEPGASARTEDPAVLPLAAEPELTPFSLEELGLSAEEIAALEGARETSGAPAPLAEPELTPFSLEELGLSAEEIAALNFDVGEETPAASRTDEADPFDFSVVETAAPETTARAQRSAPRQAEPPPVDPVDASFVPEPLEALDDVWNAPPPPVAPEVARVVLPPREERQSDVEMPPGSPTPARRARREPPPATVNRATSWRELASKPRSERTPSAANRSLPPPISIASRLELTGDPAIDEYLEQLADDPGNLALRFAVARVAAQSGHAEVAAANYKQIIRSGSALDRVVEDLEDLIPGLSDGLSMRQFYRVLGDAYTKQGRVRDAIAAYGYTLSQ